MKRITCAQRFTASKINSHSFKPAFFLKLHVLNALQHQRSIHFRPRCGRWEYSCAQRFTASKINSPGPWLAAIPSLWVLNALQHQRSIHPSLPGLGLIYGSAQRFTASKINSRLSKEFRCFDRGCSTLYSIKDQFTRRGTLCTDKTISCSTLYSIKDQFTAPVSEFPLNCMCAQRFTASKINSHTENRRQLDRSGVLNALQHQRSIHPSRVRDLLRPPQCSTLYSIKDQFTRFWFRLFWRRLRAQRFTASKINSLIYGTITDITTFSAQRFTASKINSLAVAEASTALQLCAQRFTASKINSRGGATGGIKDFVCSTLYSIKDQFTDDQAHLSWRW